ncbi:DUF3624 family protein [Aeromonas diversa]|uniref:DUF3624 family protein n=1 Tax=Aeromonas diversa TaxID=502790 RepID=UPI003461CFB8
MSCDACLSDAIKAKLGRCRTCAIQCALVGGGGTLAWYWFGADTSVNALTGALFALAGWGVLLLHLLVFLWRRLSGRELGQG